MKKSNAAHSRSRSLLQATPVAAAVAVLLCGAEFAQAQQAAAETVTITGIRRGIESAISVKKNADSIVESISSEDIGKLPDSSIAESIARLPGVSAQRVGGRATEINIRGLSGDFANTLLNGREQVSTGNNRSVQFDQYPSELIAGVDVYKTPTASLVGQGLSGTLDLKTVRPLSFGQRTISVNVRGEKNGEGTPFKGDGSRATATYIDQFADRTVGVVLGVAQLKQKTTKSRTETYGESDTTSFTNVNGGNTFTFNQGFKYFVDANDETRTGAMGAVEFKPNKNLSSIVDFFYSKFEKEFVKRGIELQVNDSWKAGGPNAYQVPTLSNAVIQNGRLISGVWGNVNPLSRTIWEPREEELNSAGWNTKWKFAPSFTAVLDLSASSAKSTERITEMEAGVFDTVNNRPLPGTVTVGNYNSVTAFQYNHGDPSIVRLTDPESWGQNGYDKVIKTDDKLKAARLQLEYDMDGFLSRITGGVNLNKRDKTKGAAESFLRLIGRTSNNPGAALPAGTGTLALPGSPSGTISFDPAAAFNSAYRFDANVNSDILNKGWTVTEKVQTLFAKGDVDTTLMGLPLRGNVGLQFIHSDQSSTAPRVDTSTAGFTLRTDGKTYNDVLPALNLALEVGGDQFVRFGAGKQMARARMDQLRAFQKSEVNSNGRWEGSGGNPRLDPFRATALDVSFEKYFGNKGYVSVAGYYKKLDTYIFEVKNPVFDFTGLPNLSGRPPTQGNLGDFTAPFNGKGGTVKGVELAASLPLGLLSSAVDGFGVQVSYSNTSSAVKPFGDSDVRPLPGLSRQVTQLTGYYEKYGFSTRVASRKRSAFLAEIEGFGADREFKYARGETLVDVQIGYEIQSGFAKGLNFLLQVNNATNEPYREYNSGSGLDTKLDEYGRTILFGISYKF